MPQTIQGDQRTAISNAIVHIHQEQYGRGPKTARTIIGGDLVTCVLEGVLTTKELSMMQGGGAAEVSEARGMLQQFGSEAFCAAVEEVTGRKVKEFISGINPENGGTAVEVFVLESLPSAD